MKLMDKIKDLFMDDVIDDDEVELEEEEREDYKEPPKKDMPALPKVMRDNIEKEERLEEEKEEKLSFKERLEAKRPAVIKKEEPAPEPEVKPEPVPEPPVRKFNFPIDFEEEVEKAEKKEEVPTRTHHRVNNLDDLDLRMNSNGNINVLNMEHEPPRKAELYPKKEEVKPRFKASPVISPVYGILDKNYTKEEVREKDADNNAIQRPSKKVDFETVRKKAFGNLADEIKDNLLCENCELYKEVKKISALTEDDLLYDMTVDEDKEVTIEKAYDNYREFGVAYEQPKPIKKAPVVEEEEIELPKELEDIISNTNEVVEEEEKEPLVRDSSKVEDEEVMEPLEEPTLEEEEVVPSRKEKKKETKVDDDFFELIDSMYKERIDE